MQSAVQIKSDTNNFTCIHCADKECLKTRPKPSLAEQHSKAVTIAVCYFIIIIIIIKLTTQVLHK